MKPKTRELLYLLLWVCDRASRPSFRNLTGSFEDWAYRNGLLQQITALEKKQLVETKPASNGGRLYRLTEAGRLLGLGPRDPIVQWKRRWDGKWRIVLFDVPQRRASDRKRLRRSLSARGFGYLQNSVWITPDPLHGESEALDTGPVDVETLILMEAQPCAGETDADIVLGAWDFDAINTRYERHLQLLRRFPKQPLTDENAARHVQQWLHEERLAWNEAVSLDPLLPEKLHPAGYRGVATWKRRLETMKEAGRTMRQFRLSAT